MGHEAIKLELIAWLTKLEDRDLIEYLKVVKDANEKDHDWWNELSDSEKQGIERGSQDIIQGRFIPHEEVKKMYGL